MLAVFITLTRWILNLWEFWKIRILNLEYFISDGSHKIAICSKFKCCEIAMTYMYAYTWSMNYFQDSNEERMGTWFYSARHHDDLCWWNFCILYYFRWVNFFVSFKARRAPKAGTWKRGEYGRRTTLWTVEKGPDSKVTNASKTIFGKNSNWIWWATDVEYRFGRFEW